MSVPTPIERWHALVAAHDPAGLDDLLADHVVFRSPAVHTPQEGKAVTTAYLRAALAVLGPGLTYHEQWYADRSAILEFTTELDGVTVHGIDMIRWDETDRIVEFTVMVRPMKGLTTLVEHMAAELERGRSGSR